MPASRARRLLAATALALAAAGCAELLSSVETSVRDGATTPADGLREALRVGTARAVETLGRSDGYLGRADLRIPTPQPFETAERALRALGAGHVVDDFVTSMNRAAEAAAPLARDVLVRSIREMTFEDALAILRGDDDEATEYFRAHATEPLRERLRPIVAERLDAVGTTRELSELMRRVEELPFVRRPAFELDAYVTERALDGLFKVLAEEERRIRRDPLARTTELLRRYFGEGAAG